MRASEEIAAVLTALAASQATVHLTLSSRRRRLQGRVLNFDGGTLLCAIDLSSGVGRIMKNVACQADCSTPAINCQFSATIAGYSQAQGRGALNVRLNAPKELARQQNRDVFRVPCGSECGLSLKVILDNQIFIADPLDASFAGLRFRFASSIDPKLEVGQQVDLQTSFCGWYRLDFKAVVQWAENGDYGVLIPQFLLNGDFQPPSQWVEVLHGLQVRWAEGRGAA